ncbi:hypothetical protein ACWN8V_07090 [Vagococcus elongatus]|uniref:Uncharacterized protein n=1 Tax=Vagococcus elongatus TaxID=180344 RepID=A0A430AW67_9ENTE|nr:hypothetical protein [Vagococcus elongatus]RSU12297.1 hypothetical protein CBF29_06765 [Vagococcus elongatus]
MKKHTSKLVIGILLVTVVVMAAALKERKQEADYYHTLHNRQTWMLQLLDDESNNKLGKEIEKRMNKDTDEVLSKRYEHMNYKGQK